MSGSVDSLLPNNYLEAFKLFFEKGQKEDLCSLPAVYFDKTWRNLIFLKFYRYLNYFKLTTQFKADGESRERTEKL